MGSYKKKRINRRVDLRVVGRVHDDPPVVRPLEWIVAHFTTLSHPRATGLPDFVTRFHLYGHDIIHIFQILFMSSSVMTVVHTERERRVDGETQVSSLFHLCRCDIIHILNFFLVMS